MPSVCGQGLSWQSGAGLEDCVQGVHLRGVGGMREPVWGEADRLNDAAPQEGQIVKDVLFFEFCNCMYFDSSAQLKS